MPPCKVAFRILQKYYIYSYFYKGFNFLYVYAMTERKKYEALIRWLALDEMAQAPDNTDGWIDKKMKEIYPELNTPSGDWGLHRLIDRAFTEGYLSYQDREENGRTLRWYSATSKAVLYAGELVKRENLFSAAEREYSGLDADEIMDMVLCWFALDPDNYKGGLIIPRINVAASTVGENIVEFYFKQLNNVDFLINLDLILDQLAIDGYVYKNTRDSWQPMYSITYQGKKFWKKGGYKANAEIDRKKMRTQIVKDWLLIVGTWAAGIGAIGLCAVEVIKHWKWVISIELATFSFVFLFGVISGLIIYQIIRQLLGKKE